MGDTSPLFATDIGRYIDSLYNLVCPTIQQFREVTRKLSAAAANNPTWRKTVSSISQFAEAHGVKVQHVGVAGGFLLSSFLLYKSVTLEGEIEGFFDEIEELKGQYKAHNAETDSLIQFHERVTQIMTQQNVEPKSMRQYFMEDWTKSREYFRNVQRILDAVEDLMQSFMEAKSQAEVNARFSALVAIVAGTAVVAGTPASMPVWLVLITGMASGSTVLSLKNSKDAQKAYGKLKVLKGHLRRLRGELDQLMERLLKFLMTN